MRRYRTPASLAVSLTSVLLGVAVLAACSSASTSAESTAAATSPAATSTGRGGGGAQRQPGVSGLIAAVSGSTMQVQSQNRQTAVTWTATTAFTKAQAGSAADVAVGVCVAVRQAGGATATGDTVSGANVQIAPAAADGTCSLGFGGGTPPAGAPSGMPRATDAPSGAPGGGPGQGGPDGRGGGVFGRVAAVSGGSFTVARVTPGGEGTTSTATAVTVTTSSSTAYTTTVQASATDVAVGQCATAQGQTSETGAVTATSVALRAPVGGSCFGGSGSPTAGGATGG